MKNKVKIALLLLLIICFAATPVFANKNGTEDLNKLETTAIIEKVEDDTISLTKAETILENMSLEELNVLIDSIANDECKLGAFVNTTSKEEKKGVSQKAIKLAWLAAAKIARVKGYGCSATLVENSVNNRNYRENGSSGLFRNKIVRTRAYKHYIKKAKKNKNYNGTLITFNKNDSSDLYYALHTATATLSKKNKKYRVNVYDKYDFDLQHYKSLFSSIVNNWAWLCQHTGVLHVIHVQIYFPA